MELSISYLDETDTLAEDDINLIDELIHSAAQMEKLSGEIELSVTFVNNERIQVVNKEYRNIDKPTDVISFALEELGEGEVEIIGEALPRVLGDIIISLPKAKEQANEYNHSFQRELGFLALHGFLHLLGYDHQNEQDEQIMFAKQKEILENYGLKR